MSHDPDPPPHGTDPPPSAEGGPTPEAPQDSQGEGRPSRPLVQLCAVADDIESKMVLGLLRSEGIEALAAADFDPGVHPWARRIAAACWFWNRI
jgi:hypothetical protein